jgi:hypothetical protein
MIIDEKIPMFTLLPSQMEIFEKLVYAAAFTAGIEDFKLTKMVL